jgi:hypothetical protein
LRHFLIQKVDGLPMTTFAKTTKSRFVFVKNDTPV